MMPGPLTLQIERPIPGKLYVCEVGGPPLVCRLAGPFETADEAQAAAGAIEAEFSDYQARTEIWCCPLPELDSIVPIAIVPLSTAAAPTALR
jgi:hypothetical protein